MAIQHIGQDFTSKVKLNMLPGISIKSGIYQTHIQYVTETNGVVTMHNISQNLVNRRENFDAVVGKDVKYITFQIYSGGYPPASTSLNYQYSLRVDQLILLNLAVKLLNL